MERRIVATHHAVERYITRHEPGISYSEAKNKILNGLRLGSRLKRKSIQGHVLWKFGEDDIIGVVKQDNRNIICVTILPEKNNESVSHFDLDNFDYQNEIDTIEERISEQSELGNILEPEIYLYDLEEYKISIKEKYALELEKHKLNIAHLAYVEKQRINKKDEQCSEFVLHPESENLTKVDESDEITKLKSDLQALQETCDRYRKIIDLSLEIIVDCLSYLVNKDTDPKVKEVFNKINVLDPTILPYFKDTVKDANMQL